MPTNTYQALATQTLSSSASVVSFTSIPQGYTDLVLLINGSSSTSSSFVSFNLNSDTGSNYSRTELTGNGSAASSSRASNETLGYLGGTAYATNTANSYTAIVNFMNYSNTTTNKTILSRPNNASVGVQAVVNLWRSTAAITRIDINASWAAGSTFTIYGVAATSVGAKATGGTIYQDSSYFYHVFSGNGTFTPASSFTGDVLVLSGGGGGGASQAYYGGGGGGAGGLKTFSSQSFASGTGYTCTVGAGGASAANGVASSLIGGALSISTTAGGKGGTGNGSAGSAGGSGGGGGSNAAGGAGTSGEGFAGGTSSGNSNGAGGGGAGAVGANAATAGQGSAGGAGSNAYSAWFTPTGLGISSYIAGGGGGGSYTGYSVAAGGAGGGGNGGVAGNGSAATIYTGSGGGGAGNDASTWSGGAGGSGLVIVRYAK